MALAAFRIWLREGDDWATHASYHRIVLEIRFRSWLGRKDSNLQPSDPESAALPLRHSPNAAQRGRANHSKDGTPAGRLLAASALGARLHPDRQGFSSPHHLSEKLLHERFRFIEVHGPANSKHAVAEQLVRLWVPVGLADPLPGRRPEVVGHHAHNP